MDTGIYYGLSFLWNVESPRNLQQTAKSWSSHLKFAGKTTVKARRDTPRCGPCDLVALLAHDISQDRRSDTFLLAAASCSLIVFAFCCSTTRQFFSLPSLCLVQVSIKPALYSEQTCTKIFIAWFCTVRASQFSAALLNLVQLWWVLCTHTTARMSWVQATAQILLNVAGWLSSRKRTTMTCGVCAFCRSIDVNTSKNLQGVVLYRIKIVCRRRTLKYVH